MKGFEKLNNIFDAEIIEPTKGEIIEAPKQLLSEESKKDEQKTIDSDYDQARNNLYSLLKSGEEALYEALEVAKQSEHPKAFEVVGNLIKQLSDVNHRLVELHSKKQYLDNNKKEPNKPQQPVTNNTAIFVGSTAELNKLVNGMKQGE